MIEVRKVKEIDLKLAKLEILKCECTTEGCLITGLGI